METRQDGVRLRSKYVVITADYIIPVLILLGTLMLWWLVFYTPLLSVTDIECELDYEPCSSGSITAEIDKYKGYNILSLNTTAIEDRLTSADFTIADVEIQKHLPNKLAIRLHSVYPTVAALVQGTTTWVTFDERLRVIGTRQVDPNVPTIIIKELIGVKVGETINNQELQTALKLALTLADELPSFESVELQGTDIIIDLDKGLRATMTTTKDTTLQIQTLQVLLRDATIQSGVSVIDLRFARPVLKP